MKDHFTVALLIETSRAYARGICRGVAKYLEKNPRWTVLHQERHLDQAIPHAYSKHEIHGVLMLVGEGRTAKKILGLGLPTVDFLGEAHDGACPISLIDDVAVGRMAVDHFLKLGFSDFGFCGHRGVPYSDRREREFVARLRESELAVSVFPGKRFGPNNFHQAEEIGYTEIDSLADWLRGLPTPSAVFACNDARAVQLMQAARHAKIRVPDEVAILGVDNDQLISDLCRPRLTSIQPDTVLTGIRACEMLEQMMQGQPLHTSRYLTPPIDVHERESTCVAATGDELVNRALKLIQQRACEGLTVREILTALKVSRTHLDARFKTRIQRSLHDEIVRIRLQRVTELLRTGNDTLATIAGKTGYMAASHLSRAFKIHSGDWPGAYRERWRQDTPC